MVEAIRQIHNAAMELSDIARIKKLAQPNDTTYKNYLKAAYELELYAAMKLKENGNENDQIWRATLLRSAGWLALKCGYLQHALYLADTGLSIPTDGYLLDKLTELKEQVIKKIKNKNHENYDKKDAIVIIEGALISADLESNQINIKEKDSQINQILYVPKNQIQSIVRLFIGAMVQVEGKKNKNGDIVLSDIRWAT